jgi:hypothetical protein
LRITTDVYRVSRTELARLASVEYLRSFWWFAAPVPIAGVIAMIFGNTPMQVMGMIAFLWPFSIPARSVLITTKASRLFTNGCHLEADEDLIAFIGEYTKEGKRLRYPIEPYRVKSVDQRGDFMILRLRMPSLAPIRVTAFKTDDDRLNFVKLVDDAVAKRLAEAEAEAPPC